MLGEDARWRAEQSSTPRASGLAGHAKAHLSADRRALTLASRAPTAIRVGR